LQALFIKIYLYVYHVHCLFHQLQLPLWIGLRNPFLTFVLFPNIIFCVQEFYF
jgi:hypothetical protein